MVGFLAGIMRSLKAEHWRRALRGPRSYETVRLDHVSDESQDIELRDPVPGPEHSLIARQALTAIMRLFADDPLALQIIGDLGQGLSTEQIRSRRGISKTDCDSARKRMRRRLLRGGLTCGPK